MSNTRNDIPSPNAPNFDQRMRETLMTYLGRQGDPLNRGVTVRDLVKNGVAALPDGYTLRPGTDVVPLLPVATGKTQEIDLTPPPQPTGFAVAPAVNHVFIEHDGPSYSQGGGHLRTRVYGTTVSHGDPLPVFGNAAEITQFSGTVYAHPSNPATTWHLWIKWESKAGVLSVNPAGGTNGLEVTTAYDAEQLVKALTGQITESHLYRTLTDEESMSDAVGRLRGTIAAHKAAQETLNASATVAESVNVEVDALKGSLAQKVAVLESRFGSNVAALQQSFEATADALGYVGTQYTVKTALTSNGTTVVGGFGLVGTSNEDAPPTIDFGVIANKFFVAAPATHDLPGVVPFSVVTTATSDGDGGTIPPGVYIEGAYIKGGSISGAAIKGGTITGSKLIDVSADKLTAGSLQVGEYIQSAISYDYGSGIEPVWKIDGNGNAKFNNAIVRGTVYATNGQFWGTLLGGAATTFNSGLGFYAGGGSTADGANYRWRVGWPAGYRIEWDGYNININSQKLVVSGGSATFSGTLSAADGVFSGSLSGATGTFAGTLAAGVIDSAAFDSISYEYTNVGTFSLTVPNMRAGWTSMHLRATIIGAGGGGGGGGATGQPNRNPWSAGGGGGAGRREIFVITSGFSTGSTISVVVGAGGAGGAGTTYYDDAANVFYAAAGSSGGQSRVVIGNTLYIATGGGGGGGGTIQLADANQGGGGGSLGGVAGEGGTFGSTGYDLNGGSGGAGGSSVRGVGGAGGTAAFDVAGSGSSGGVGAGGGGGAAEAAHADRAHAGNGGDGGRGYVLLEFFDPNTVVLNSRYNALIDWIETLGIGSVPAAAR